LLKEPMCPGIARGGPVMELMATPGWLIKRRLS
jgi:hypothetical protein